MRAILFAAAVAVSFPAFACPASYYGAEMHGRNADGSPWRPNGISMAHRTWAFGTMVEACFRGRCAIGPVKDRGPFVRGRCADLSQGWARAIGMTSTGEVSLRIVSGGQQVAGVRRRRTSEPVVNTASEPLDLLHLFD